MRFDPNHVRYMQRAIDLATAVCGSTDPNPPVGAVLVSQGRIVGEGWTKPAGQAHAEIMALIAAGDAARGATLFCTLEPCSHWGRTPPCVDAVVSAGVSTVYVALQDPNPRVNGRGIAHLRDNGLTVHVGVAAHEATSLIAEHVRRLSEAADSGGSEDLPESPDDLSWSFDRLPRSSRYSVTWMLANSHGINPVWLMELLTQRLKLESGMKVLDLACNHAASAIFLAKEFDVHVWAVDSAVPPSENQKRIYAAGVENRVVPILAESTALPFEHPFFDVIVSLDEFRNFGADEGYLSYASRFLVPGGRIGITMRGRGETNDHRPRNRQHATAASLAEHLHSPDWWTALWSQSNRVEVELADMVPDGWKIWLRWLDFALKHGQSGNEREAHVLRLDAGRTFGLSRVVARKLQR